MNDASAFAGSVPDNYDRYLGPVFFEPFSPLAVDRIAMRPGMKILEVAAGTGRVTAHLAQRLPIDGHIVATDLNEDMLEIAKGKISDERVNFQPVDAQALPFEDGSFDAVVCQFGVMFFPEKSAFMSEAFRVLKPHRRLMYSVWDSLGNNPHAALLHSIVGEMFPDDPPNFLMTPFGSFGERENLNLLAEAGFMHLHFEPTPLPCISGRAVDFARGMTTGTPLFSMLAERGVVDFEPIVQSVGERFAREFGDLPMQSSMQAIFVSGEKPG